MELRKGRSILEPRKKGHKVVWPSEPRFRFRFTRRKKGRTTMTPDGSCRRKEQIITGAGKPTKLYIKNPKKQMRKELKTLTED